ncbi:hypothetical protein BS333_05705 [Vibrio azureus]|nr:M91 family zinc metallopeptidase [Vibrio azureus]AUI87378.1 hypothetical protein BS333_05705 [Vibrio azureus]
MFILILFFFVSCSSLVMSTPVGQFYSEPDSVNVIYGYNSEQYGKLYRVSKNLYVQTKDDSYLARIKLLINKLKMSSSGREILHQIGTYVPVNSPDDSIEPLIEHSVGVDSTQTTIVSVIREPSEAGKLFETIPSSFTEKAKLEELGVRIRDGKGVSSTVLFSTTELVDIPGTSTPFDQAVALGHELIHARDYASGAVPHGNIKLSLPHPTSGKITHFSIPKYEYQTTGIQHFKNAENGIEADTTISEIRLNAIAHREEMYYRWKSLGFAQQKTFLKNEKPVSEFHLADELGAPKRGVYWPGDKYSYKPYTIEQRPEAFSTLNLLADTTEGKQAHLEVKRALGRSLSEGKKTAIVLVDPTEERLSQSIQSSPIATRRGLGNQRSILKYAAKNDIKVINAYSSLDGMSAEATKRTRVKSRLYRAIAGQSTQQSGYSHVQFNPEDKMALTQELADKETVLVMAYSDGQATTKVVDNLSADLSKQVLVSRHSNLDYQPSTLNIEDSTAWRNIQGKDNVQMLSSGGRARFNICSIQ